MSRIMAGGKGRILNEMHTSSYLSEKDVPGASLNGRDPVVLTVPQLKRWLQCRNASTKGKKPTLLHGELLILFLYSIAWQLMSCLC